MKTPLIKIDVRDWTGDPRLRLVSLAARGLWLECLCIMRSAPRTGYLETSRGVPVPDGSLARIAGVPEEELPAIMRELADAGIPAVEEGTGVWYCRRMVEESGKAGKCSEAGRRGGGNPALKPDERKPRERAERKAASSPAADTDAKADGTRPRNPLMDALAALEGDIYHLPDTMWSKVAKALKNIKSATPDVTPEEIARRAENYRTHFRDAMLTCTALASHWARCEHAGQPGGGGDLFNANKPDALRNQHVYVKPYEG